MSISLTSDSRGLVIKTPYNPDFVTRLKQVVSDPKERSFDGNLKVWVVDPRHAKAIQHLILLTFGSAVELPQIVATNGWLENHEIRVEYIGQCKQRTDGQVTATGFDGSGWNVIFPENVLKGFFEGGDTKPQTQQQNGEHTLYQTLLITQIAVVAEIKKAYRRLALQWHPDTCREPNAQERFIEIKHAYDVLIDPMKRKRYDAGLAFTSSLTSPKHDDFDGIFGAPVYRSGSFRPPLRCGLITINGHQRVGRIVVEKIIAWNDIVNPFGQTMVSSWRAGAETFEIEWV